MLVGNEGHLITAAHVLGKPGLKAAVTLADGRTIEGTSGGMDRASDLGLVKLPANVPVPQPGLREWIEGQERNVFVTVFHAAEGGAAQSGLPPIWRAFDGSIWTGEERGDRLPGAALLNWDGAVVGVQTRRSRFGGTLYSKTLPAQQQWDRLKRGEIWGEWLRGAGPTLGMALVSTAEGCRVGEPLPGAAAGELKPGDLIAKLDGQPVDRPSEVDRLIATKDPGDEVTLELVRAGQRQQIKLQLQHR
jgi:serine protease Do